ncbi:MAG: dihydroxyacetone kinase family protein [Sciscionella sp.]
MTRLFDDPAAYAEDMLAGFVAAHPEHVRAVPGGVVRAHRQRRGKVAVLTGGGAGHYPAFCGVVGPGFADGAVVGNVFTSPSAQQAYSVGRAAESGAGVLYLFGNYAGDVMNFGLAAKRLGDEGIQARTFAVTDDVASAPASDVSRRRGIAGDFTVFKTASAAAEEGRSLPDVEDVARRTNDRTRSLGVAFAGCTLPGASEPLFTVADGTMGVGLGIHGEPGVSEAALPSAAELARTLVDGLLAEAPPDVGDRVTVILNGLGSTKYEELYVLWGHVSRLLAGAGLTTVQPEVGELVTSLDMAGCSLTLTWLDDELERLWRAPVDTPAYRKGTAVADVATGTDTNRAAPEPHPEPAATLASGDAVRTARSALEALRATSRVLHEHAEELGKLDAVAGDGDHGRGMCRGADAALAAAEKAVAESYAPSSLLAAAGDAWAGEAGGTSGALWGAGLRAFGAGLPAGSAARPAELAAGAEAALAAVTKLGKAEPGDKTLVDALVPFTRVLRRETDGGAAPARAFGSAVSEAENAARATAELTPRIGRARPLAERSVGTPDPGATSLALILRAAYENMKED